MTGSTQQTPNSYQRINVFTGGWHCPGNRITFASGTWPSANRAVFIPFRISVAAVVKQLYWYDGATLSGNIDMGIYTHDGTLLVSTGSLAQSGGTANTIRAVDVTDTLLSPGLYYFGLALDNATGTVFRNNQQGRDAAFAGLAWVNSSFPLPATITLTSALSAATPYYAAGFTGSTVL